MSTVKRRQNCAVEADGRTRPHLSVGKRGGGHREADSGAANHTAALMTRVGQWVSSDDPIGQLSASSQPAARCSCEEAGSRCRQTCR